MKKEYITNNNVLYAKTNEVCKLRMIKDSCVENTFNEEKMHCYYDINKSKAAIEINTNIIFAINMVKEKVNQDCNKIPITLIKIKNCKVQILNIWYDRHLYEENSLLPNPLRHKYYHPK